MNEIYIVMGVVVTSGDKRGIEFRRFKDGNILDESLVFLLNRRTNYPVGWLVKISKKEGKGYYFEYFDDNPEISNEKLDELRKNSFANEQYFKIKSTRKKATKLIEVIGDMTLKELIGWSKKSYFNKRALIFYLLELI